MIDLDRLWDTYRELQVYVGWTDDDARRVQAVASLLVPCLDGLVEDFYEEIQRHANVSKIITGGPEQIQRLKGTLKQWLMELLHGPYDRAYVQRRGRVGYRHVEIGLEQVYTNAALSRLRKGLLRALQEAWTGDLIELLAVRQSLNLLLDLDLAVIEYAYQEEYNSRQQRTERLATIGQVSGSIAHELRNPLNVIKTSAYYLLNARNLTPAKQAEHLARIERHVTLADGVITALANFTRLPLPSLVSFSLMDCAREALEVNPVSSAVAVRLETPEKLPHAVGDPNQIRIVIGNLIRNAVDAMPEGGTLTLAAAAGDGFVRLSIRDTGTGVAPDQLQKIMEPLYSTKARGLGLGLSIARTILEKHRGRLEVVSEPGQGSTFTLVLPAVPEEERA